MIKKTHLKLKYKPIQWDGILFWIFCKNKQQFPLKDLITLPIAASGQQFEVSIFGPKSSASKGLICICFTFLSAMLCIIGSRASINLLPSTETLAMIYGELPLQSADRVFRFYFVPVKWTFKGFTSQRKPLSGLVLTKSRQAIIHELVSERWSSWQIEDHQQAETVIFSTREHLTRLHRIIPDEQRWAEARRAARVR